MRIGIGARTVNAGELYAGYGLLRGREVVANTEVNS